MPPKSQQKQSLGLKSLDFMGSKFSLTFPTPTGRFQTNLGGSITILMGVVSVTTFVVVMSQYFNKDAPIVTTSEEIGQRIMKFNLYRENLFNPLNFFNLNGMVKRDWNRLVTIKAIITEEKFNQAELIHDSVSSTTINYIPCSQIQDPKIKDFVARMGFPEAFSHIFLCPDLQNSPDLFTVVDNYDNLDGVTVRVYVFPCSLPASQCAPYIEVKTLGINYMETKRMVEPSDFENPLREFMIRRRVFVDPKQEKYINLDMQHNKVVDDTSRFSDPETKLEYSTARVGSVDTRVRDDPSVVCSEQQILTGFCRPYVVYNYHGNGNVGVTSRNYKKWTEMLGEFGGILKVITSSLFFVYTFYNIWRMGSYLERVMLAPTQKDAREVKELLGFNKNNKTTNKSQLVYSKVAPAVEKLKEEVDPQKILKSLLTSSLDVEQLLGFVSTIKLIEKLLFFDEDQKKLIPLVLFNLTQTQSSGQTSTMKGKEEGSQKAIFKEKGAFSSPRDKTSLNQVSYSDIYQSLLEKDSIDPLKASMRELMLKNLQKTFKTENTQIFTNQPFGQDPSSQMVNHIRNDNQTDKWPKNQKAEVKINQEPPNPQILKMTVKSMTSTLDTPDSLKSSPKSMNTVKKTLIKKNSQASFKRLQRKSKFGNLGRRENQAET